MCWTPYCVLHPTLAANIRPADKTRVYLSGASKCVLLVTNVKLEDEARAYSSGAPYCVLHATPSLSANIRLEDEARAHPR
jgi:hypothetical protein